MNRGVPYDHQLEYIESTGTQYIDTGHYPSGTYYHEIEFLSKTWGGREMEVWGSWGGGVNWNCWANKNESTLTLISGQRAANSRVVMGRVLTGTSNRPICIFAWYNNSWPSSGVQIFRYQIRKASSTGELVLDYVPVSVNGVAMMYDRVTGTFPKHYGTFVAGPVASTPLMGVHMYPKVYTAADFVQNGLIGIWDAIENVDWGVHKSNVPAPVNLIDGKPLTINGGIEIGADYFKFGPGQWGYSECAAFASAIASKSFTIEIVAKNDKVTNAGIVSIGSRGVWLYSDGISNIQTLNILSSTYTPSPQIAFKSDGYWRATILGGESPSIVINDQTTAAQYGTQQSVSPTTLYIGSLAANPSWSNGSLWVKSIRLYSRTLTTDERNHNRSVDLVHF